MEKCNCGGSGFVTQGGVTKPCICKVLKMFERYMKPFMGIGPVPPAVKSLVDTFVGWHRSEEQRRNTDGVTNSTIPKRWFLCEPEHEFRLFPNLGTPSTFYNHFFYHYLLRTNEYIDYKFFDLPTLMNVYFSRESDLSEGDDYFYGFKQRTFIIVCRHMMPNKEAHNVLKHFLHYYRSKNILIYADAIYRKPLMVNRWIEDERRYREVPIDDRSLYKIITQECEGFVDIYDSSINYTQLTKYYGVK